MAKSEEKSGNNSGGKIHNKHIFPSYKLVAKRSEKIIAKICCKIYNKTKLKRKM